ncbi:MAG: hypothetical protein DWQ10_09875 [Calditrichaeota bacterium]|nr:MAG: hypothetical protein DWQ10_09875 [Calditrichota bacterium]
MKIRILVLSLFITALVSASLFAQEPMPEPPLPEQEQDMHRNEKRERVPFAVAAAPLDDEQKTEALQFITNLVPEASPVLAELENENPRAYERELRQALREKRVLARHKKRKKEEYENAAKRITLQHKTQILAYRYRKAEDSEKPEIKKQLHTQLSQLFDLRERDRELEIQQLEKRLDALRKQLEKRKPNKDKIIEKRLDHMLGLDKELQW